MSHKRQYCSAEDILLRRRLREENKQVIISEILKCQQETGRLPYAVIMLQNEEYLFISTIQTQSEFCNFFENLAKQDKIELCNDILTKLKDKPTPPNSVQLIVIAGDGWMNNTIRIEPKAQIGKFGFEKNTAF